MGGKSEGTSEEIARFAGGCKLLTTNCYSRSGPLGEDKITGSTGEKTRRFNKEFGHSPSYIFS
jgi:hypothetical protein